MEWYLMDGLWNFIKDMGGTRKNFDKFLKQSILIWMNLRKCMHFIFQSKLPPSMQKLKEFFYFRIRQFMQQFIWLELLKLS